MYPPFYSLAYLVVLGIWAPENLQSASVFLAAAFLIWNYETMLPSKTERWIFTLASAAVTLFFQEIGSGNLRPVLCHRPDERGGPSAGCPIREKNLKSLAFFIATPYNINGIIWR